jgi:hypothetical protein
VCVPIKGLCFRAEANIRKDDSVIELERPNNLNKRAKVSVKIKFP